MRPIFQQPMRRVRHDLMGHFNFLALAHWGEIVQIDIYYYFQSFFNEHEYKNMIRKSGQRVITPTKKSSQRNSIFLAHKSYGYFKKYMRACVCL
jgi:hypothetical protein